MLYASSVVVYTSICSMPSVRRTQALALIVVCVGMFTEVKFRLSLWDNDDIMIIKIRKLIRDNPFL